MSNALHVSDFLNPNKGNAAFSVKQKLNEYKELYYKQVAKDLLVSCTYNKRYDRWCFFFKYPSEGNEKYPTAIMYDIMIEFNPTKKSDSTLASLDGYDIYIYSNAPSFIFTFDYVIKKQIGFPKSLPSNYLSKVAITKPPRVRNTFEIMTAEKTTWICFFHLYRNGYLSKNLAEKLIGDKTKGEEFYIKQMQSQPAKLAELKAMNDLLKSAREAEKMANKNKNLSKTYKKETLDKDNPLSVGNKLEFSNASFKSGLNRINPLKFLNKVEKRNTLNAKGLFKATELKSNL